MRLLCCDDHEMFLEALRHALTTRGHAVRSIPDVTRLPEVAVAVEPDVCLIDLQFPGGRSGVDAARLLRAQAPELKLVLLTGSGAEQAWAAFDQGVVDAAVNKACDIEVLDEALASVHAGQRVIRGWNRQPPVRPLPQPSLTRLTTRERQVLELLVQGSSTRRIAETMGVSVNTVRTHVQNLLHKLDVHGRGQAARLALDHAHPDFQELANRARGA